MDETGPELMGGGSGRRERKWDSTKERVCARPWGDGKSDRGRALSASSLRKSQNPVRQSNSPVSGR